MNHLTNGNKMRMSLRQFWLPEPSALQQLVKYAKKTVAKHGGCKDPVVEDQWKIVGMKDISAIIGFDVKKRSLGKKLKNELESQGVILPGVIKAMVEYIEDVSTDNRTLQGVDIDKLTSECTMYRATFYLRPNPIAPDEVQFAMALSGIKFTSANVIEGYEEESEPIYERVTVIEEHVESGWLGDRKVLKEVEKNKKMGTRTKKRPVFSQKFITKEKLKQLQDLREWKTMSEVKELHDDSSE
jgi:hypothetical protein